MIDVTRDVLAERLCKWIEDQGGDMPISAAKREVKWFFDELCNAVAAGHRVNVMGFGKIERRGDRVRFRAGSRLRRV